MTPSEIVASALAEREIEHHRFGDDVFVLSLRGERKLTIPVTLFLRDRTLVVESFFMRAPAENREALYRMLLARNVRARSVHFALGDHGDVYLVGMVPLVAVSDDSIDAVLAEVLTTSDETFDAAIAVGFETYLALDLAWRARQRPS